MTRLTLTYRTVAVLLGAVLLLAATLKAHQLMAGAYLGEGLLASRWLLIGIILAELLFGLWLLSGLYPRRTWGVALICFTSFFGFAMYQALAGAESCGCFGKVQVNPVVHGSV